MRAGGSALCLRYAGHGNKQSPVGIYILTALFLGGWYRTRTDDLFRV